MFKYVAIAAAAMFMTASAHASSGCSEKHENVSRVNPTELSDYQKCVYAWKGQEIGTVGNYIWMQHNGDFIHIHKDKLIGKSQEDVRDEIFKAAIGQEIADELAQSKADLAAMERLQLGTKQQLEDLQKKVDRLETITVAVTTGMKRIDPRVNTGNVEARYATEGNNHFVLNVGEHNIYTENAAGYDIASRINDRGEWETYRADITTHNGVDFVTVNLSMASGLRSTLLNRLVTEIERVTEAAYKQGYEDGYKAGYIDGYNAAVTELNRD